MKKLIIMSLLTLVFSSLLSAKNIWDSSSIDEWNSELAKLTGKNKEYTEVQTDAAKYVFTTDLSKVSYRDFKNAIFNNIYKNKKFDATRFRQICLQLKPARKYFIDSLNDKSFTTPSYNFKCLVLTSKRHQERLKEAGITLTNEMKRAWCMDLIKSGKLNLAKIGVDVFEKELFPVLKNEEILNDLKEAKKILYLKITNDAYKPLLIKVELMIKSVQ